MGSIKSALAVYFLRARALIVSRAKKDFGELAILSWESVSSSASVSEKAFFAEGERSR